MPYVAQGLREELEAPLEAVFHALRVDAGMLNYVVTRVVSTWVGVSPRYERFNAAIGALECAKLELYRRMVAPYEDRKCAENGDVYLKEET